MAIWILGILGLWVFWLWVLFPATWKKSEWDWNVADNFIEKIWTIQLQEAMLLKKPQFCNFKKK